jgi:hypothetical protein
MFAWLVGVARQMGELIFIVGDLTQIANCQRATDPAVKMPTVKIDATSQRLGGMLHG